MTPTYTMHVLGPDDKSLLHALLDLFAVAFDEDEGTRDRPSDDSLRALLGGESFVAIAALRGGSLIGGLTGYFLPKPESVRPEFYLYDLAVSEAERRRGVATALIERCRQLALSRRASSFFVQAHPEDGAAVALYRRLGTGTEVLHFDIALDSVEPPQP